MTILGICVEWFITFIETAMCHLFFHLFFEDRFPKKKQRILFLFIAAVTTTGVILLNLVELSFSVATVLYAVSSSRWEAAFCIKEAWWIFWLCPSAL